MNIPNLPPIPGQIARRAVGVSQTEWIRSEPPPAGEAGPLAVRPAVDGLDLISWVGSNRSFITSSLARHGGILFQGFDLQTVEAFQKLVQAASDRLMEYEDRSSPRSRVSGDIFTSTDHPADQAIPMHNENSYSFSWPMKICFYCVTPPFSGGETPVADSRRVLQRIDERVSRRLIEKNVMYVRNFGDGLGLSWQTAFQASERSQVEDFCRRNAIDFEWKEGDRLRTRQVRPAVAQHPRSGESVWFNQAALFHVSSLEPAVREELLAQFREEDLPVHAFYGDGTPLEPFVLEEINRAYGEESLKYPWQKGDVLMLDNMLMAHGRSPFQGPRKIVVGMAEPCSWSDLR